MLYDNPVTREQLVDASFAPGAAQPDPATMSFSDFSELAVVQANVGVHGGDVEDSAILDILYNDFRRE